MGVPPAPRASLRRLFDRRRSQARDHRSSHRAAPASPKILTRARKLRRSGRQCRTRLGRCCGARVTRLAGPISASRDIRQGGRTARNRSRHQCGRHHQNRRRHGVEICLSAADIPNTTFARTSIRLMFGSCNERPGCDRDCGSLRSGSGMVHLWARSSSSPSLTPLYWSTALALPATPNRGLSSCKSLSYGQNATSAAAGLGSNA